MQNGALSHFGFLFARGFSATFLVGGLVVEHELYGLREGTVF
jgi:hypothetical protein